MVTTAEMINGKPSKDWKPNTKLLYATATAYGWTHQGVKDLIFFNFKRQSTKDLTFDEYYKVLDWFERLQPNTVTAERDKLTGELFQ